MKKHLLQFLFALSFIFISAYQATANVSSAELYAQSEFKRIVGTITGSDKLSDTIDEVVIGTPQSQPRIKSANLFRTDDEEEIRIVTQGKTLFLAGKTSSAALYATYTFLDEVLGVRWFWPGESGEYIPRSVNVSLANLDITQVPDLKSRSLSINSPHYDGDTLVWMARQRMNVHLIPSANAKDRIINLKEKGFLVGVGGHNVVLSDEILQKHPEYAAEINGKRELKPSGHPPHLCWANPGVQEEIYQKILSWIEQNPDIDILSFYGADHNYFCQCGLCKNWADDVSTRWQKFSHIVIERLKQKYPAKRYRTLAYQAYRGVPQEVATEYDLISYATYNINYTKPLDHSSNETARNEMLAWKNLGAAVGIRGYQFIPFKERMFAPIVSTITQEIAWSKRNGLKGWYSELTPYNHPRNAQPEDSNWVTNRMALYAAAKAMWNAQVDPKEIVRDWTSHVYGPAGAAMNDYYWMMDDAWNGSAKGLTYFLVPAAGFSDTLLNDERIRLADGYFAQARAELSKVADVAVRTRIAEQIELESKMFAKWRELYNLKKGQAGRYQVHALKSGDWANTAQLPDFIDVEGQPIDEKTRVNVRWDNEALSLRFVLEDKNPAELKAQLTAHDGNIFGDDNIEMFIQDPVQPQRYFHMSFNSKGLRYDALSDGAMNFDKAWNPQWTVETQVAGDHWVAQVRLPFAEFGFKPQLNAAWNMSFTRSGARRRPNTGWPTASYHNPSGFGKIVLVDELPAQKRALFYEPTGDSSNLRVELSQLGFRPTAVPVEEAGFLQQMKSDYEAVVLRYSPGFALSQNTVNAVIRPYLEKGGFVLVAASRQVPLQNWFGEATAVTWSGTGKLTANRKTSQTQGERWKTTPHNLDAALKSNSTPTTAFEPQDPQWEALASLAVNTGGDMPYLLRRKVGDGTLVLTSSNFGYSGGHEVFGSSNPQNAAKLLDNLLADHNRS